MSSLERRGCDGTNGIIQKNDLTLSPERLYFTSLEGNEMSLNWDNCFIFRESHLNSLLPTDSATQLFLPLKPGTINC